MIAVNVALCIATFFLGHEILSYISAEKARRLQTIVVKAGSDYPAEDQPRSY